jgi:cyclopropane-fatty-acyl-phospholipid synthase
MLRYALLDKALERDLLPDAVLRLGSRWGTHARIRREARGGVEAQEERLRALVARMSSGPIAEAVDTANEQHYELPAEFFGLLLGPRRKYSGCLWSDGVRDLAGAEAAMLELTCARAGIQDGMRVLDLGCGWGSLSLWVAEQYPNATVVGVSNSNGQREWIMAEAERRGLANLEIRTQDMNEFGLGGGESPFDRVVSLEMFEHMRNWAELLRRVSTWLAPGGKLFVHVFSQRRLPYLFEGTWAADRFFTAGLMPSHELLGFFQRDMQLEQRWVVPGTHYAKTLQAWLANLDANRDEALRILGRVHPPSTARRLLATWRLFLISTDEIWGWRDGNEWLVSHYLLSPRAAAAE